MNKGASAASVESRDLDHDAKKAMWSALLGAARSLGTNECWITSAAIIEQADMLGDGGIINEIIGEFLPEALDVGEFLPDGSPALLH